MREMANKAFYFNNKVDLKCLNTINDPYELKGTMYFFLSQRMGY